MNYININKKRLVGRNNQQITNALVFDYSTIESVSFQLINDQNQIQEITNANGLYFAGSYGIGQQSYELLFLSKDYEVTSGNILTFQVDTYTINYLNKIRKKFTEINIEIGQCVLDKKNVILRDCALACPRVYVDGLTPQEIDSDNYYTKAEVDELISSSIVQSDWDVNDDTSAAYIKNRPTIPTKVSELENDEGYLTGYTEVDPVFTSVSGTFAQLDQSGKIPDALYYSNKQRIYVDSNVYNKILNIEFNPNYDVIVNTVDVNDGAENDFTINSLSFGTYNLSNGEIATFENWIKSYNNVNILRILLDQDIVATTELPEDLDGTLTHVFTRRIYKDENGVIHEAIAYSYSF